EHAPALLADGAEREGRHPRRQPLDPVIELDGEQVGKRRRRCHGWLRLKDGERRLAYGRAGLIGCPTLVVPGLGPGTCELLSRHASGVAPMNSWMPGPGPWHDVVAAHSAHRRGAPANRPRSASLTRPSRTRRNPSTDSAPAAR